MKVRLTSMAILLRLVTVKIVSTTPPMSLVRPVDGYRVTKASNMKQPLTFFEWCSESDVEEKYQTFHDEYGDAAALLSDYKQYHYEEYLADFKRDNTPYEE